jgi:hypothetical protein
MQAAPSAKTIYLILTDKDTEETLLHYELIKSAVADKATVKLLFHQKGSVVSDRILSTDPYLFTHQSLLMLNYLPVTDTLIPGSAHFPLLEFYLNYPVYDYYWLIEDDVQFNGDWNTFFEAFRNAGHDFITTHIRYYAEEPLWTWWRLFGHLTENIPYQRRLRSFNPIYRISRSALDFIHSALLQFWIGHHEVLYPTLLHENGFRIMDMGGDGRFVPEGFRNVFYTSHSSGSEGRIDEGTFRFRPCWAEIGNEHNKLYHPVKQKI